MPRRFSERHGPILIIAIGESIVAIGVGAEEEVDAGIVAAAVNRHRHRGGAVVAVLRRRRARRRAAALRSGGRARAERDGARLLLDPAPAVVAGHRARRARDEEDARPGRGPAEARPRDRAALRGAAALYLRAHVAFRYRHIHTLNTRRLGRAVLLVAFIPAAVQVPAIAAIAVLAVALAALIAVETRSYGESRSRPRRELREKRGHDD